MMELASSLVEGAKEDLIDLLYNYVVHVFKVDLTFRASFFFWWQTNAI